MTAQEMLDRYYREAYEDGFNDGFKGGKIYAVKTIAERIKTEFYKEFDEIIPSVMADKIDEIAKEMVGGTNV